MSEPKGFARARRNGDRRSGGSDSGSTNRPSAAFRSASAPATKPNPDAAPTNPNKPARFTGGVTSAMYAVAVADPAAVIPESTRPTNRQRSVGLNAFNR